MSQKKTEQANAKVYELLPNQPVDISEAAFADIEQSLARVDAMKKQAAAGIVKAKERGLTAHVERFRVMLRKLVIMDNELKAEKEKKITARLAAELDQLESEFSKELYEYKKEAAEEACVSEYIARAKRHSVAAVLFGLVGGFACLLGCIIYFILIMATDDVPFEWGWVIADGVLFFVFALIGLCLARSAAVYNNLADEEEYKNRMLKEARREQIAAVESDIAAQAFALERESEDIAALPAAKESLLDKVKALKNKTLDVEVNVNQKALVPVVATGAAVLALAALTSKSKKKKKKKAAEKKKSPKLIIDWE